MLFLLIIRGKMAGHVPIMLKYSNSEPDPLKNRFFKKKLHDCIQLSIMLLISPQSLSGDNLEAKYTQKALYAQICPNQW